MSTDPNIEPNEIQDPDVVEDDERDEPPPPKVES